MVQSAWVCTLLNGQPELRSDWLDSYRHLVKGRAEAWCGSKATALVQASAQQDGAGCCKQHHEMCVGAEDVQAQPSGFWRIHRGIQGNSCVTPAE